MTTKAYAVLSFHRCSEKMHNQIVEVVKKKRQQLLTKKLQIISIYNSKETITNAKEKLKMNMISLILLKDAYLAWAPMI